MDFVCADFQEIFDGKLENAFELNVFLYSFNMILFSIMDSLEKSTEQQRRKLNEMKNKNARIDASSMYHNIDFTCVIIREWCGAWECLCIRCSCLYATCALLASDQQCLANLIFSSSSSASVSATTP